MIDQIVKFKKEFHKNYGDRMEKIFPVQEERNLFLNTIFYELERNDVIFTCGKRSIMEAILNVAALGLNPAKSFEEVHIYPFGKKGSVEKIAQVVIGYRGFIALGINTGIVKDVYAQVVYEGDAFEHNLGTNPFINHQKSLSQNLSNPQYFYACARMPDNDYKIYIWTRAEAEAFKLRFSKPGSFWNNSALFVPMCLKQVIRNLFNTLPKKGKFVRALEIENENEQQEIELQSNTPKPEPKPENKAVESEFSKLVISMKLSSKEVELLSNDFGGDKQKMLDFLKQKANENINPSNITTK